MGNRFVAVVVALGILGTTGCAAFRSGQPLGGNWPPQATAPKLSISVVVSGTATINGSPHEVNSAMLDTWRRLTWAAYQDSGAFAETRSGLAETDLRAEVSIREDADVSYLGAILTGLTMYLFPSKASSTLTATTRFSDASGADLGTVEKKEGYTLWQQLFLVFVMPAHFPTSVAEEVITDLSRATIVDANTRGLLKKH